MKIIEISNEHIKFDNGSEITFEDSVVDWSNNYADFSQLEELAFNTEFDEELIFEAVEECGFRFGSRGTPMFFIPCYSVQNGYYSAAISIFFNDKEVLCFDGGIR